MGYRKSGNSRVKQFSCDNFSFSYASRPYENILTTKIFLQRKFRVQRYTYDGRAAYGIVYSWPSYLQRNKESLSWRGFAVREGSPQRGGSILCCCEERSRRRTFTAKSVTLLTERGHNGLHSNWGKKTLRRSTPRRPGSSLEPRPTYASTSSLAVCTHGLICRACILQAMTCWRKWVWVRD